MAIITVNGKEISEAQLQAWKELREKELKKDVGGRIMVYVVSATHHYKPNCHTMSLEVAAIDSLPEHSFSNGMFRK